MNISRILESLDECDRTKFCEAIADTLHTLSIAIDLIPDEMKEYSEVAPFPIWKSYLELIEVSIGSWKNDHDDAGDKALQEAYDIIATDDIDPTDTEQLATELMRGWH